MAKKHLSWLQHQLLMVRLQLLALYWVFVGIGRCYAWLVGGVARWRYHQIMVRRVRRIGRK